MLAIHLYQFTYLFFQGLYLSYLPFGNTYTFSLCFYCTSFSICNHWYNFQWRLVHVRLILDSFTISLCCSYIIIESQLGSCSLCRIGRLVHSVIFATQSLSFRVLPSFLLIVYLLFVQYYVLDILVSIPVLFWRLFISFPLYQMVFSSQSSDIFSGWQCFASYYVSVQGTFQRLFHVISQNTVLY